MKRIVYNKPKFLIDENLSPRLSAVLHSLGFDALSVQGARLSGYSDSAILAWAMQHKRVIITQDLGFGLVYTQTETSPSIILLRSKTGTTEAFRDLLQKLHESGHLEKSAVPRQLIVASEKKIRTISTDVSSQ